MSIVSVKFKLEGKAYNFDSSDILLEKNDYVLVETEKGIQLGRIVECNVNNYKNKYPLKKVIKKASKKDYNQYLSNLKSAKDVVFETKKKVEKENIPMRIIDASFTFDKKQLIINFIADERIDFRELVKYLAAKYKAHIELHQIGVRDKAKELGGIGHCGRILCCNSFKNNMDGISINMAKNQNISLNPSKINGCCGRLLCCLSYEDETYSDIRNSIPKINDEYSFDGKVGKVVRIDVLKKIIYVNIDGEEKVVDLNEE